MDRRGVASSAMDEAERRRLPHGVVWRALMTHADDRGVLTELFRAE